MCNTHKLENMLEQLTAIVRQMQQYQQKSLLNIEEAAIYLGITKSTLYKHTSAGHISYFKPNGKIILFKVEDLNAWVAARRVPSNEELSRSIEPNIIVSPIKKAV